MERDFCITWGKPGVIVSFCLCLQVCLFVISEQVNSWKKRVANLSRELEDVKADVNY